MQAVRPITGQTASAKGPAKESARVVCCAVLQVNGMDNRVLMKRFDVKGFPSIYLLRNGQTWQYNGVRGIEDVSFFRRIEAVQKQQQHYLYPAVCGA